MSKSLEFDPSDGFVALPSHLMDLDLPPGPFRLLIELCRMANKAGECWPSLEQLSERVGRSKAALSGYLDVLRDAELIRTTTQKMANGYNYRLKYRVTFWEAWRSSLSGKPDPKKENERTVHHGERRVNSKNHIQENHCAGQVIPNLESLFFGWVNLTKGASFPDFNAVVPPKLINDTQKTLDLFMDEPASDKSIASEYHSIWSELGVDTSASSSAEQIAALRERNLTQSELSVIRQHILKTWKPHWSRLPSQDQFAGLVTEALAGHPAQMRLRALSQYLRRARFAQKRLQARHTSQNVSSRQAA